MTNNSNFEKYDRQIRTFGKKATEKINSSDVYLCGLKGGLGTEVAKNLVLSGVKNLYLIDNKEVTEKDVEFGYYYNESHLTKKRAEVLLPYIQELNQSCNVKILPSNWHLFCEFPNESNCIIMCNIPIKNAIAMNDFARENKFKTVYVCTNGLSGFVFVDCLSNHIVYDLNDENILPVEIIRVLDTNHIFCTKHKFQQNDIIKFTNLKGDNLDYLKDKKFKISNLTKNSLTIVNEDDSEIDKVEYNFINGTVEIVKEEHQFNHTSLKKQLSISDNSFDITGFDFENTKNIVDNFTKYQYIRDLYEPWSENMESLLRKIDTKYHPIVRTMGIELSPVNSILGGIGSTEVIKLVTNKYTPISQFYSWNDFSIYPKEKPDVNNSSYLSNMFGETFVSNMKNLKVGMVGCGALGCEWLKNLSLLNIGTENGFIDVTDPDHIEVSNLSRQFLFRSENVKQSKSRVAMNSINKVNHKLNINAYEEKISNENKTFTDKFFDNKTIVINALDNLEARKYVDSQCFNKNLPLFESGTMGMKGNTQPVIPFLTETYSNSNDPEVEEEFAICTIKNFPNSPHHTIHWARDYFELFNRAPNNLNKYFENPDFMDSLSLFDKNTAIKDINMFLGENYITGCSDILVWSKKMFTKIFNHDIKQLLHCFPKDHKIDGNLFWSNGKKCPEPLDFSTNIDFTVDFIEATLNLLCNCFGIYQEYSRDEIKEFIINSEMENFVIDKNKKIAKDDSELKQNSNEEVKILDNLNKNYINFVAQEFEKDDDFNWHVKWINAASNCRSLNYNIKPTTVFETKGIAGKIIPAVATTTSTIVGLISFDLLKFLTNSKLEDYKSYFVNMADNMIMSVEPIKAPNVKIGDTLINSWTKYIYNQDNDLQDFINEYEKLWNLKIDMILFDSKIIYSSLMSSNTKVNIVKTFKDEYNVDLLKEKISLTMIGDIEEELPNVILNYFIE